LIAAGLFADGGSMLFREQGGPYEITLFGTPSPLRVGRDDLSVLVQRADNKQPVMNANIKLHLYKKTGDNISEVFAPARHDAATNKMLYAAMLTIPVSGTWRAEIEVIAGNISGDVIGQITVREKQPPLIGYWPYLLLVPLAIILFALNRWLRRRMYSRNWR
jgi:ABC-type uncharacterized transport system involved in gliding motility auxiliary subunit